MLDIFAKSETSLPLDKRGSSSYHFDVGAKWSSSAGSVEGLVAFKQSANSRGGFGELKLTSPSAGNIVLESRTRVQFETSGNTVTQRVAVKYSQSLPKGFSIYNITGASAKFSMEGDGTQSITPVCLTGVGYKFNKELSGYCEYELCKGFDMKNHAWGKASSNMYIGVKYTF